MLEFSFDSLDLVNIQLGSRSIRTWEWSKLLQECCRVTRPAGTIRAVEQDFIAESTSPAFNRLMQLLVRTYYQAGHLFAPVHDGLLGEMPRLFDRYGVRNIQTRSYSLELRADTPDWQDFARSILFTMTPFVAKWMRLPADYEALCQQALLEIAQPDFRAMWKLLVVWGDK
jgi:ubiquinone/menaquinone biosynthesis C-methylase UbiE